MTERHESSCSVYNAPAYEPGPCDCKYREPYPIEPVPGSVRVFRTEDMPAEFREAFEKAAMSPEHDHLNALMDDDPIEAALDKAVEAIRMSDQ